MRYGCGKTLIIIVWGILDLIEALVRFIDDKLDELNPDEPDSWLPVDGPRDNSEPGEYLR